MTQKAHRLDKRITRAVRLDYWLYAPRDYGRDAATRWPLILFLHGMGERGNDLALIKKHGIPKIVEQHPDLPYLAVSPQCPADTIWHDHIDALDTLLKDVARQNAVDPDRIYVTGLSRAAMAPGSWRKYPRRFAAIVPICGARRSARLPGAITVLTDLPVWASTEQGRGGAAGRDAKWSCVAARGAAMCVLTVYPRRQDAWTAPTPIPNCTPGCWGKSAPAKRGRDGAPIPAVRPATSES